MRGGQRTTFEADNTFTGDVSTLDAGTILQVGTGSFSFPRNQIPDTANVTLAESTTLQLNGDSETVGTLNSTGNNAVVTTIAGGPQVLTVTNGGNFAGRVRNAGFTIESTGGTLTLSGTVDNDSGQVLVNGGTVVLAKTSTASVHAAASNVTVNTGTLRLGGTGGDQIFDGSATARTAVVVNGGQFDLNGLNEAFSILDGFGGVVTNSVAATTSLLTLGTNNWSNTGYFGSIQDGAGTVALTKIGAGGLILAAANAYTGVTTIAGGVLQLGNGSTGGSIASASIVNNGTLVVNRADAAAVGGVISGPGRVILNGTGTTTLSGANTYTGGTTINAGVVNISTATGLGAASGRLTINNNATLQAGGSFTSSRAFGLANGGGTFDTNGFDLTLDSGSAVAGSTLTKIGAGTLTINGTQCYTALISKAGVTTANTPIGTGASTVSVSPASGAAAVNFGANQTLAALDIGNGGVVTLVSGGGPVAPSFGDESSFVFEDPTADATMTGGGFSSPTAALAAPALAVPEPGTLALLAVGVLRLLGRRRRRDA